MKRHIEKIKKMFSGLVSSDFASFKEVSAKKNITGVYIIYSPMEEVLYIGSTNKFNIRFGTDLKHESTHTLMRKLLKQEIFRDRKIALKYLSTQCKFRILTCDDKREAEALEHFTIYLMAMQSFQLEKMHKDQTFSLLESKTLKIQFQIQFG